MEATVQNNLVARVSQYLLRVRNDYIDRVSYYKGAVTVM